MKRTILAFLGLLLLNAACGPQQQLVPIIPPAPNYAYNCGPGEVAMGLGNCASGYSFQDTCRSAHGILLPDNGCQLNGTYVIPSASGTYLPSLQAGAPLSAAQSTGIPVNAGDQIALSGKEGSWSVCKRTNSLNPFKKPSCSEPKMFSDGLLASDGTETFQLSFTPRTINHTGILSLGFDVAPGTPGKFGVGTSFHNLWNQDLSSLIVITHCQDSNGKTYSCPQN